MNYRFIAVDVRPFEKYSDSGVFTNYNLSKD